LKVLGFFIVAALTLAPLNVSLADNVRTVVVKFPPGSTGTTIEGRIRGRDSVNYILGARNGQFLKVSLDADNTAANYNIYVPGRGPGDEALFTSDLGGMDYTGQLYKSGDHTISVFLNRAAARRGEVASYKLYVTISSSGAATSDEGGGMTADEPDDGEGAMAGSDTDDSAMKATCKGAAAGLYGIRPAYVEIGEIFPATDGFSIEGTADKGDEGMKSFNCVFDADRSFNEVIPLDSDGE
jgi:hypothetical protein